MSEISVSKITNIVGFKTDANSYNQALKKIRNVTNAFAASQNSYKKSMEAGKRIATANLKTHEKLARAEITQQRNRKQTLRADNIRYQQTLNQNKQFKAQLQSINAEFLKGNLSFKERSAVIGVLNREYRKLNNNASKHNGIIKGIGTRVATGAVGLAATGAATLGITGAMASKGFDRVKQEGQSYESLVISLRNTFGDQTTTVSNIIRQIATEGGRDLLETGLQLVNYVSIVKSLGIDTGKAIDMFKKQSNMTASYGMSKDAVSGFQYGLMQTMASNTLEDFKQAMDWSPQIKADLLKFVKDTMGLSQKDFMGNLTNGKYNFKDVWLKFVEASAPRYAQMAQGYKQSSMANDARASNSVSVALYRIFESSGFKQAMKASTDIVNYWSSLLESNSSKIGEIFGNLYNIARDLSKEGFGELSLWLKSLTKEDIKGYFGELKTSMQQFSDVMKRLFSFLDSVLPSAPDQKGQYYIQREKYWLNQGYSGQEAGRLAEGEMRKQFQLGFTVPTLENSLVRMSAQNTSSTSNHQATLDLKINTEVNQPKIDQYVWATVETSQTRIFNQLLTGS